MPLVVPILRLGLLFLNVYETFKTLRSPRRSSRNGEPLLRSVSQRKRAMKGCMAVWLVWCTTVMAESFTDKTFGLIIPFYGEMKTLIYLFQIVTRARGAEPLYLHVLRPCVKPYVATLDLSLDIVQNIGELLILVIALPYFTFLNWWNPSKLIAVEENATPATRAGAHTDASTSKVQTRSVRRTQESLDLSKGFARTSGLPHSQSESSVQSASQDQYQIWHPSTSTHDRVYRSSRKGPNSRVASDPTTTTRRTLYSATDQTLFSQHLLNESAAPAEDGSPTNGTEDWRSYPPFPSAYPPTPQAPGNILPSGSSSSVSSSGSALSAIKENANEGANPNVQVVMEVEGWRQYPPFPSAYPPTPQAKPLPIPSTISKLPALGSVIEQVPDPPSKEPDNPPVERQEPLTTRRKYRPIHSQSNSQSLPTRTRRKTKLDEEVSELGTRRRRRPRPDDSSQDAESGAGQDFGLSLERLRESVVVPNSQGGLSDDRNTTIRGIRGLHSKGEGNRSLGTGGPIRASRSARGQRLAEMPGTVKASQAKTSSANLRSASSRSNEIAPPTTRTISSYSLSTNRTINSASTTSLSSQPLALSRTSSTASDVSTNSVAGTKRPRAAIAGSVMSRRQNAKPTGAAARGTGRSTHKAITVSEEGAKGPPLPPTLDRESDVNEPDTLESSGGDSFGNDEFETPKTMGRSREPSSKRRRVAEQRTSLDSD